VILLRLCRNILLRLLVVLVIISSLIVPPAFCQETEDSQIFIAGFNAYQQKDYASSIDKMNEVLQKYPDTPLRDMALFWLSRSYFKTGNQQEAARYLSQFSKEYPDNPLKSTVEDELLSLTARYEKGEKLSVGTPPVKQPDRQAAQKAKAEKERIAAAKAEEAKRTAAAAEAARIAALKQAEENAAAEKREQARVAAIKVEQERAASAAAKAKLAAAAAAESARIAEQKRAEEKAAAEKNEQERIATAKAAQERVAAVRAEEAKLAAAAESARLTALKQSEEKAAAEKKEQARIAALKADQERITLAKSEGAKLAASVAAAESARLASLRQAEEQVAAKKKELERVAAAKAEQERIVAVKAKEAALKQAEETAAAEKNELARIAAVKAEQERIAAAKAEEIKLAVTTKAEQDRVAAAKREVAAQAEAETARIAAQKAERDRISAIKAEEAKLAQAAAESARLASIKAEAERKTAELAAKEAEKNRLAALKAEESRLAQLKRAEEKIRTGKLAYREKAIGQYKAIIDKFPASSAAVTAAAKLRELGVAVALPPQAVEAPLPANAQVLRLEVAQFAGFEFNLLSRADALTVGKRVSVPFEVINRGNGTDSFYLESTFPAAFKARFASLTEPAIAINQTPLLSPGEKFTGNIEFVIPSSNIDGQRITYPVKAASRLLAEASQSREVRLIASAPLLRAVLRTDKAKPLPGDKVVYRIAILNVGSTAAQDVTFRLSFPPQLEPVDYAAAGFRQEMKSALVFDGLQVQSGESREFSVTFQLKDDSLAGQELSTRAELINNSLKTTAAFVSNMAYVEAQRSIVVRTGSDILVAIPGQSITVPFIVTNTGNIREKFNIKSVVNGAQDAVIFNDLNRDGIRQASEPVITEIGPLAPREEANVVVEIKTPLNAVDGSQGNVMVTFTSEGDVTRSASGSTQLNYSRPVLKMVMAGRDGRLKPGDVASFDLTITNNGSNLARVVELQTAWPEQLELIAADPATSSVSNGTVIWRFKEMGAGEKRVIKVSFRVKPGTGVGTAIQVKNILTYEDQLGNRY
jgi:uncharacterized repeat protein (TIGR01451 family)